MIKTECVKRKNRKKRRYLHNKGKTIMTTNDVGERPRDREHWCCGLKVTEREILDLGLALPMAIVQDACNEDAACQEDAQDDADVAAMSVIRSVLLARARGQRIVPVGALRAHGQRRQRLAAVVGGLRQFSRVIALGHIAQPLKVVRAIVKWVRHVDQVRQRQVRPRRRTLLPILEPEVVDEAVEAVDGLMVQEWLIKADGARHKVAHTQPFIEIGRIDSRLINHHVRRMNIFVELDRCRR
ncbi:hypothetical protein BC940DRAFT_130458 [Gongronella butleri]|nr:hypothetical protein BC940DRAFT_130458 [Gongronella butleri]